MKFEGVVFSGHAIRRMFERRISREEVLAVLQSGEVIADYPEDAPFPSRLMLGFPEGRPLHVAVALNEAEGVCIILTAYDPDPRLWGPDFRKRRPS